MKGFFLFVLMFGGLFSFAATPIFAKGEKIASDPAEVDLGDLVKRVGALETLKDNFKFGLLLQARAALDDTPSIKVLGNTVTGGLDDSVVPGGAVHDNLFARRAELKFYGGFAKNTIQYAVMIDPVGVPAATKGLVQDYYITVSPIQYLDFTVGQAKYPQGLEGRTSAGKLDFINRSILGGSNGLGELRDFLVQVSGSKVPLEQDLTLDYALAAVNGQGRNNPENNDSKDGAVRLGFQYRGLWIGGSAYDGFEQAPGAPAQLEMWRAGAEAQLVLEGVFQEKDRLKFQTEWGQGSLVNENGITKAAFASASGGTGVSGFYAEGVYRWAETRLGVRYELWDPKDIGFNSPGFYQNYITAGMDQFFSGDHYRVSLNWIHPILDSSLGGVLAAGEIAEAQFEMVF